MKKILSVLFVLSMLFTLLLPTTAIAADNEAPSGTITIFKYGDDELLAGVSFALYRAENNEKITELATGAGGRVSKELPLGRYYLIETTAAPGYALQSRPVSFTLSEPGEIIELWIENARIPDLEFGKLKLTKIDANDSNKLLSGAVFGVYQDGEKVGELETGAHGWAEIELPVNDYYLLELSAPEGYQKSDVEIPFRIVYNETTELTVSNTPEKPKNGCLQLIKAEKGKMVYLGGAVFGVYNADTDEKICELTTGTDGKASMDLPQGSFYLKELIAPAGYQLVADKTSFVIKPTQTVTLTVENPKMPETVKTGYAKVIKRAEGTNGYLQGAIFGIYRASDNEKVAELTSGKDGTASVILPVGDYYLLELKAPANFQLKSDKINFTVKENQTTEMTFTNKAVEPDKPNPGKVVIIKKDEDTSKPLSGAVFGVYDASDDKLIGKLTTQRDGTASMELKAGRYYLCELTPPKGYQSTDKKTNFTIKDGGTSEITVTNKAVEPEQATGTLLLVKSAQATGNRLAGAVFGVYKVPNNEKITEVETAADGTVTLELDPGDFYLRELKAPAGYRLDSVIIPFSITKAGVTTKVEVTNELETAGASNDNPSTGGISIPKTGETPPYVNYIMAALFMGLAGTCGVILYCDRRKRKTI